MWWHEAAGTQHLERLTESQQAWLLSVRVRVCVSTFPETWHEPTCFPLIDGGQQKGQQCICLPDDRRLVRLRSVVMLQLRPLPPQTTMTMLSCVTGTVERNRFTLNMRSGWEYYNEHCFWIQKTFCWPSLLPSFSIKLKKNNFFLVIYFNLFLAEIHFYVALFSVFSCY